MYLVPTIHDIFAYKRVKKSVILYDVLSVTSLLLQIYIALGDFKMSSYICWIKLISKIYQYEKFKKISYIQHVLIFNNILT